MTEITTPMTSDPSAPVGSEANPLVFDVMSKPAPDQAAAAVASLRPIVERYEAAFHSAADLSANLPADLRQLVSEAASAITATVVTADSARSKADGFRNNVTMYPAGRDYMASEAIKAATGEVAESFNNADTRLEIVSALTYEAARPRVPADAAMPARADLQMMTQRHIDKPGALAGTLKRLAQRSDAVGALVADQSYLSDFLDAQGVDPSVRDAMLISVRAEVIKAAAASGDPKRAAAAKTSQALVELKRARAAAMSYTRHKLNGK
ncbi:hypothetical protein J7E87_13285 [Streptomyces sp. ISL-1]|uniref:hypothetical protein n=1 Tax=Streptomyces sp. ISL-1 TaxID=2817657 RepID=UPI001BE5EF38|nr:hypothetical protein [Streptomyces sp. ISL-1]MBT2390374.1 hypothetical protein [Streptomyces sp. ISL-1]